MCPSCFPASCLRNDNTSRRRLGISQTRAHISEKRSQLKRQQWSEYTRLHPLLALCFSYYDFEPLDHGQPNRQPKFTVSIASPAIQLTQSNRPDPAELVGSIHTATHARDTTRIGPGRRRRRRCGGLISVSRPYHTAVSRGGGRREPSGMPPAKYRHRGPVYRHTQDMVYPAGSGAPPE